MLRWAISLLCFADAILFAVFGFGGIAGEAAWIGKVLLVVYLILTVVSVVVVRRSSSAGPTDESSPTAANSKCGPLRPDLQIRE
jgi:uncharacterized membrane protein YtjA (UPF0391 family)